MRVRGDETRVKAVVIASPPPALPVGASFTLQSASLCLSAPALDCSAGARGLSCR